MTSPSSKDNTIRTETTGPEDLLSLDSLCEMLSVSAATGRNWVRLGKLSPQVILDQAPYFTREYMERVHQELQEEQSTRLKSRRNKKYISGNEMYHSYVSENSLAQISVHTMVDLFRTGSAEMNDEIMKPLLAECAIQLLLHDTIFPFTGSCLEGYLKGRLSLQGKEFLIKPLIENRESALHLISQYPQFFRVIYYYEEGEDTLGLLYISLKNIGTRKAKGLYFTPARVVRKMCEKVFEKNPALHGAILDPCCGTGNFLLQLPADIPFERIYGQDTDILSIIIARINLSLRFGIKNRKKLQKHITFGDYLLPGISGKQNPGSSKHGGTAPAYDLILGNPPWGYEFSEEEKKLLKQKYQCTYGANIESYDVFLERSLQDLNPGGVLSFVLPEAMLNVKAHAKIREILIQNCRFQYLEYLGNVFDKVQCPCIIFQFRKASAAEEMTAVSCATQTAEKESPSVFSPEFPGENCSMFRSGVCCGMEIQEPGRSYVIETERSLHSGCFSFWTNDEEYAILEKMKHSPEIVFLKDQADFALGIVTGDNNRYISGIKTHTNERILRGSDLRPFSCEDADQYIEYRPKEFQQVAPDAMYRAPEKLLYRFISDRLIFSYDNRKTLSLNSCNILIPRIEGLNVKYILAVLNSRMAQFYYEKTFHSLKVLRSHIEQIPIPMVRQDLQERIVTLVDQLMELPTSLMSQSESPAGDESKSRWQQLYDRLDLEVAILYGLDYREYDIVKKSIQEL